MCRTFYIEKLAHMTPAMVGTGESDEYQKGVKHLVENGLHSIPKKYILPPSDRPGTNSEDSNVAKQNLELPIIDYSELLGPKRQQVLQSLANACEGYGFFQVRNHIIFLNLMKYISETYIYLLNNLDFISKQLSLCVYI